MTTQIDIALLRVIKNKIDYDKVHKYIPKTAIDQRTLAIVRDVGKYWAANEGQTELDLEAFRSLFFNYWHPKLNDESKKFYSNVLKNMEDSVSDSVRKMMVNSLVELEFATDLANNVEDYTSGSEIDIVLQVDALLKTAQDKLESQNVLEFADFDDHAMDDEVNGMSWHVDIMNEYYREMIGGDQYIIAARPGKGKTSFLTHLCAHVAPKLPENKIIIWFNNESRRQRIMSRQIQSTMNMGRTELHAMDREKLKAEYAVKMGSTDKVRVYDIHRRSTVFLEEVIKNIGVENIGMIITDMLDNVEHYVPDGTRTDQKLEKLYQWHRELGVMCDCPMFPTSQVSNEGAGLLFPTDGMLKDSKTGKQGACDGIIMIGHSDDPMKQNIRGLSMAKSKSKLEGMPDMQEEVTFDADKGRYVS